MLNQQVFMLSVDEYQKKTGKSWDVLKAARLLRKWGLRNGKEETSLYHQRYYARRCFS